MAKKLKYRISGGTFIWGLYQNVDLYMQCFATRTGTRYDLQIPIFRKIREKMWHKSSKYRISGGTVIWGLYQNVDRYISFSIPTILDTMQIALLNFGALRQIMWAVS